MAGISPRPHASSDSHARLCTGVWRNMIYKSFRLHTVIRILLLSASLLLLFTLITQSKLYATTTFVVLIILYQVFSLIRYVERTNLELGRFLRSIRYADFS